MLEVVRTTLDIDDTLMQTLLARHPGVSKTEAIEHAIRAHLRDDAVARIRHLAGSVEIDDASAGFRASDRSA